MYVSPGKTVGSGCVISNLSAISQSLSPPCSCHRTREPPNPDEVVMKGGGETLLLLRPLRFQGSPALAAGVTYSTRRHLPFWEGQASGFP